MTEWKRYRKKPVEVEAIEWNGEFIPGVIEKLLAPSLTNIPCRECSGPDDVHGVVKTLNGDVVVCPNELVVRGIKGELYPCKRDIFDATYEELLTWDGCKKNGGAPWKPLVPGQ